MNGWSYMNGASYFILCLYVSIGIIRTALPNMDREARQEYDVVIQAKDMGGHMGGLSGTTQVKITLTDVNDNPPKFAQGEIIYSFSCECTPIFLSFPIVISPPSIIVCPPLSLPCFIIVTVTMPCSLADYTQHYSDLCYAYAKGGEFAFSQCTALPSPHFNPQTTY